MIRLWYIKIMIFEYFLIRRYSKLFNKNNNFAKIIYTFFLIIKILIYVFNVNFGIIYIKTIIYGKRLMMY